MISAFQSSAFQNTGFQVYIPPVVVEDDDHGHWHYAKLQRQRRQKAKAAATVDIPQRLPLVAAARFVMPATALRAVSATFVHPILATAGFSVVEPASLTAKGQFIIRPIVRSSGVVALQSHVSSEASVRVVNVLNELRDLEDMIDLYELLIAA